jgi:hypothetical protein
VSYTNPGGSGRLVCPYGHPDTGPGDRFCATCGTPLASVCANGHQIDSDARWCPYCGIRVATAGAGSSPAPASWAAVAPAVDRAEPAAADQAVQGGGWPDPPAGGWSDAAPALPAEPQPDDWTLHQPYDWTDAQSDDWTQPQPDDWTEPEPDDWTEPQPDDWTEPQPDDWTEPQPDDWTDPPGPSAPPAPPHIRRRSAAAVVAGLAVLAAIGVGAYALAGHHSHGYRAASPPTSAAAPAPAATPGPRATGPAGGAPATTAPAPALTLPSPAEQEARILSTALAESAASRTGVAAAVTQVAGCANLASAMTRLVKAADDRRALLGAIRRGEFSRIPNSRRVLGRLSTAVTASAEADSSYAAWAADENKNCTPNDTSDPNFRKAARSDQVASAAKRAFVAGWDPIARTYGLVTWTADQI